VFAEVKLEPIISQQLINGYHFYCSLKLA